MYELIFTDGYDITREIYSSYDEAYSAMKSHFDMRKQNNEYSEQPEVEHCDEWSAMLRIDTGNTFTWRIFKLSTGDTHGMTDLDKFKTLLSEVRCKFTMSEPIIGYDYAIKIEESSMASVGKASIQFGQDGEFRGFWVY